MDALARPPDHGADGSSGRSLSRVLYLLLNGLAVMAAAGQLLIDFDGDNAICVTIVLAAALLTLQYLERTRAFEDAPISSLALLGLCVTTQWTSLVAQTASGHALIDDLQVPVRTFALLGSVQALAVGMHWLYRRFEPLQQVRAALTNKVLIPLGAFAPMRPAGVWLLSMIGTASLAFAGNAESGDAGNKFFQALAFFAWMPAMIPIQHARYGANYCRMPVQVPLLVAYAVLLVGIGMALNIRQVMLIGPIQLLLVLAMYGLRSRRAASGKLIAWLAIASLGAGVFIYVARDLATAMVVVRDQREQLAPMQMLEETMYALADRSKLDLYRDQTAGAARFEAYDEVYLDNPLLGRFSETKFHDNMLALLMKFSDDERASIAEVTGTKILTTLPQPVLDYLGLGIDKERFEFSIGDFYRSLNENDEFLGGYATGSMWVDLLAVFGWWAPLLTAVMLVVLYALLDMQSLQERDGTLVLSALAVCSAWSIFLYGLGTESLAARVTVTLRGLPERVLLYCLAAAVMRMLFPWRPPTTQPGSAAMAPPVSRLAG